jgi:hypothetical protein
LKMFEFIYLQSFLFLITMLSGIEGHELLVGSLTLFTVYLDIFLELLGPANCVAKIAPLVRGVNSS